MLNLFLFACAVLTFFQLQSTTALRANNITSCPKLTPRKSPPNSIRDLRPDDIKVFMAMGDSITAGFGAKGLVNGTIMNITNLNEDRGISYAIGGDPGSTTIPNLFSYYTSNVGPSVGEHLVELCYGVLCPPYQYHPSQDNLNAAQSGALALDLQHELDYLIPAIKAYPGIDFDNDWKFLNLQIGSNDLCLSCVSGFGPLSADDYESYVRGALENIRQNVPKVIVNLVSTFNVSQVYEITLNQTYCQLMPGIPHLNFECPCALLNGTIGDETRATMDNYTTQYNARLLSIRNDYAQNYTNGTFGVIYQPADINIKSLSIEFFSNVDCFHPSAMAHFFLAKFLWNGLFVPLSSRNLPIMYDLDLPFFCPNETDRLRLD